MMTPAVRFGTITGKYVEYLDVPEAERKNNPVAFEPLRDKCVEIGKKYGVYVNMDYLDTARRMIYSPSNKQASPLVMDMSDKFVIDIEPKMDGDYTKIQAAEANAEAAET